MIILHEEQKIKKKPPDMKKSISSVFPLLWMKNWFWIPFHHRHSHSPPHPLSVRFGREAKSTHNNTKIKHTPRWWWENQLLHLLKIFKSNVRKEAERKKIEMRTCWLKKIMKKPQRTAEIIRGYKNAQKSFFFVVEMKMGKI